jgi:hypothetical protein
MPPAYERSSRCAAGLYAKSGVFSGSYRGLSGLHVVTGEALQAILLIQDGSDAPP